MSTAPIQFRDLALVVLAVGLITMMALRPGPVPVPLTMLPVEDCEPETPTSLKKEYELDAGGVLLQGKQVIFRGISLVSMMVCDPGELVLDVEPKLAGREWPRLTLGLGDLDLGEWHVGKRQTIRVEVPASGKVTLGYFNDYYRSEARIAFYENFRFSGTTCDTMEITAEPATGGAYDKAGNFATATSSVPIIIKPCDRGVLSFLVLGRSAHNAYPSIKLEQSGKSLSVLKTTGLRRAVQVEVEAQPLRLSVINPYFRELEDRSLTIHSVEFLQKAQE